MVSILAAFLLIFVYFVTDTHFRTDKNAQKLKLDKTDRQSTSYLLIAYGVSMLFLLVSPLFNLFRIGRMEIGGWLGWIGVIFMVSGIVLRAWSARVLGRFYTRTLITTSDQRIVQEGPYQFVRHPGYSGSLLVWIGAGIASANWITLLVIALVCCIAYLYRIASEEKMLSEAFGTAYRDYQQRTRRVIPFLY